MSALVDYWDRQIRLCYLQAATALAATTAELSNTIEGLPEPVEELNELMLATLDMVSTLLLLVERPGPAPRVRVVDHRDHQQQNAST